MLISSIIKSIYRKYLEKFKPNLLINYYRKKGIKIGEDCNIGPLYYTDEAYLIEIGNHVAIAGGAVFITHDASLRCFDGTFQEEDFFGMIRIGNNVNIGMHCIFLPNTTIGNNCIVGAGSVIRGKFPDNSVIFGNPAKVVTNISVQKLIISAYPHRLRTAKLTDKQKELIVKKHFGIE